MLPRYCFLLKYLQFLCLSPWQTFLNGGTVYSGSYFYLTFGNIKELLMSLGYLFIYFYS